MTEAEVKLIAEAAAKAAAVAAVDHTMLRLGIDPKDPEAFTETRNALAYARRMYGASETIKKAGLVSAVGVLATAFLSIIWLGFKSKILELFSS